MEKLLNNINKVVVYLIMALGVAFTIYTIANASELTADSAAADKILNPYFLLTLVTFIIAGASVILFPIGQMISNPKNALRAAISI
jgi:polyferredoxin